MAHGEEGEQLTRVQAQIAGVGAQKTPRVDRGGQDGEVLLLQGLQIATGNAGRARGVLYRYAAGLPCTLKGVPKRGRAGLLHLHWLEYT